MNTLVKIFMTIDQIQKVTNVKQINSKNILIILFEFSVEYSAKNILCYRVTLLTPYLSQISVLVSGESQNSIYTSKTFSTVHEFRQN